MDGRRIYKGGYIQAHPIAALGTGEIERQNRLQNIEDVSQKTFHPQLLEREQTLREATMNNFGNIIGTLYPDASEIAGIPYKIQQDNSIIQQTIDYSRQKHVIDPKIIARAEYGKPAILRRRPTNRTDENFRVIKERPFVRVESHRKFDGLFDNIGETNPKYKMIVGEYKKRRLNLPDPIFEYKLSAKNFADALLKAYAGIQKMRANYDGDEIGLYQQTEDIDRVD